MDLVRRSGPRRGDHVQESTKLALQLKSHVDIDSLSHLTEKQKSNVRHWKNVLDTMNAGHFDERLARYFHSDMKYVNPNRPDLTDFAKWRTSPEQLYLRFPPSHYRIIAATAIGDEEIWVHCHHVGALTGGSYMHVEPRGQEIDVQWFSTLNFKDGKIVRLFSIADILGGILLPVGIVTKGQVPANPYT
jgi:hypothetical protein